MPDGYVYSNWVGGWQICKKCGCPVADTVQHTKYHEDEKPD